MSSAASPEPERASSGEEGGEDWCKEDITTMHFAQGSKGTHAYGTVHTRT